MESEIDIGEEYWLYHEKYIVSQHNFECNSCWCNYRVHTVSTPYCVSMLFYHERTQLKYLIEIYLYLRLFAGLCRNIFANLRFPERIEFYGCRSQPKVRQHIDPCSWRFKPPAFHIAFPCIIRCPDLFIFRSIFLFCTDFLHHWWLPKVK